MIRVYADFNARTADGGCWILQHGGTDLGASTAKLGLTSGDRILLYQDDDDFEVQATLEFRFLSETRSFTWIAYPDWDTVVHPVREMAAHK